MGLKTPVAFLVFNRPDTTEQVFAAIRQAQPEVLLIVADGPRPDRISESVICAKVREITERIDWPCRVLRNYSEANLGCKIRVSSGLDWVFSEVDEAIILEDDCLPHPSFFPFCEKLLSYYRDDERVMMISGTNYLLERLNSPESYAFSRYFAIWGWASWGRAWRQYDVDMQSWPQFKKDEQLRGFYTDDYMRRMLASTFDATFSGRLNTWDSQWFFTCLFHNGLSIVPRCNLISNIGTVGTHTNGELANNFFPVFPSDTDNLIHPAYVIPNQLYDRPFFTEQFNSRSRPILRKLKTSLKKRLQRLHQLIGRKKTGQ